MSFQQTAGSPTPRRVPALIAALATLAAGLAAAIVPSSPAQAGPGDHIVYCEEHRLPDGRRIVPCWVLDELWPPLRPDPDPCLTCPPYAVQFTWTINPPDYVVNEVAEGMFKGLRSLLSASIAEDPKDQEAFRAEAWQSYLTAASGLGQAKLSVGEIWIHYDPETGLGDPSPQPNRELFKQYGNDAILGLDLLRAGLADPKKFEQYEAMAHEAFDSAATAFAEALQTG